MEGRWVFLVLFVVVLNVIGTFAGGHDHHDRHHDDDHHHDRHHDDHHDDHHDRHHHRRHHGWHWGSGAGIGVLALILGLLCGLVSLGSWLSCRIYEKCRTGNVGPRSALTKGGALCSGHPSWFWQLVYQPELSAGFGQLSEGLTRLGSCQLLRHRQGKGWTDGATWAMPMTSGKHVFEITWPWAHRGPHSSVGVATGDCPIKVKGTQPLVGHTAHSWGLDLVARRVLHGNRSLLTCPTDGSYVPDKFLMFVNVDESTLGFGSEVTYWGDVISTLPKQGTQPLYLMVGLTRCHAEVAIKYIGSAPDPDMEKTGKLPHHLPPLYPGSFKAPPTYTEVQEDGNAGDAILFKPALPDGEEGEGIEEGIPPSPPPAYVTPPVGLSLSHAPSAPSSIV